MIRSGRRLSPHDHAPRSRSCRGSQLHEIHTPPEFLEATGCELEDVHTGGRSWAELCEAAGLAVAPAGPEERALRRACGRLLHVDDAGRIEAYRAFLARENAPRAADIAERERRLLRMLVGSLVDQVPRAALAKQASLDEGCALVWEHPAVRAELLELLEVLGERISHVPHALGERHADVPLVAHARYSRIEILAAFGVGVAGEDREATNLAGQARGPGDADPYSAVSAGAGAGAGAAASRRFPGARVAPWQMGVYWADEERADLLVFTLDKTSGAFSPTTRYRDYAVSRELIHWESQNVVRAERLDLLNSNGQQTIVVTRLRFRPSDTGARVLAAEEEPIGVRGSRAPYRTIRATIRGLSARRSGDCGKRR